MFQTAMTPNAAGLQAGLGDLLRGRVPTPGGPVGILRLLAPLACLLALPMLAALVLGVLDLRIAGLGPVRFALTAGLVGFGWVIGAHHVLSADTQARVMDETPHLKRTNTELERIVANMTREMADMCEQRSALEVQLTIDPLTGVQNRRGLDAAFDAHGAGTVLALVDIDHFKKINDTLGHDVGDRVLKDFADKLRQHVGGLPVYRVGGEEFVILFPESRLDDVATTLDRFRVDLRDDTFTRINDRAPISFSAGLTLRDDAAQTFDTVFKRADERLYAAKMAGRARTVLCDDTQVTALAA